MADLVQVDALRHQYGSRVALDGVSFAVTGGECFALLGPNGGGKTTLFRILTTLLTPSGGTARICSCDVRTDRPAARRRIGVVFQSPSLDIYLTVRENLRHAGHLYGMSGRELERRIVELLGRLGLAGREDDLVKTLSGGQRRRAEIAKGLLHEPALLILDEPSTGLDPVARRELWQMLQELRQSTGVTILLTTHFMEEAERCDQLAILDRGRLVACGSPAQLKGRLGGDCITIQCDDPAALRERAARELGVEAAVVDGMVRIETADGPAVMARLMATFAAETKAITLGRPTLEDVFVHETGRRFDTEVAADAA
ncbi:MAG TPA: ABC transporter ATP-binding protein [Phycisphaerae bacterium]|nr:ABC transporter ATP-binding protein [Phycisphaerae bacterium]